MVLTIMLDHERLQLESVWSELLAVEFPPAGENSEIMDFFIELDLFDSTIAGCVDSILEGFPVRWGLLVFDRGLCDRIAAYKSEDPDDQRRLKSYAARMQILGRLIEAARALNPGAIE